MANVLSVPLSGNIYFHCGSQSSVVPDLTGSAVSLGYDGSSGIKVTSFNTAASATDRFTVAGTGGSLFSVNDALTGTIFSVNDASGLPIIEVNSSAVTDTISIGEYGTNALFISAGSVGIGTVTPITKLHIDDDAATGTGLLVTGGGNGQPLATFTRDVGGTGSVNINSSGSMPQIRFASASNSFTVGTNDSAFEIADNVALGTNTRFSITSAGNVGIGTASPSAKLEVAGSSKFLGTTHHSWFNNGSSEDTFIRGGKATSKVYINDSHSADVVIASGGGKVGIGTAAPNGKLAIESKANGSGYGFYLDTLTRTGNDTVFYMTGNSSGNEFVITAGSNVGIGTTTPGQKLDVAGNIKASGTVGIGTSPDATHPLKLLSVTQGRGLIIRETDDGNDAVSVLGYNGGGTLAVKTAGANTFYVDATSSVGNAYFNNSGKFGVGTATPNEKLDVVGNIKASGTVTASGSGSSSFVGNVGIGTTAPSSKLEVVGNINASGTITASGSGSSSFVGNVGIGTTTPGQKLTIAGTLSAQSSITGESIVKRGGTSSQFLKADGSVDSTAYTTNTGTICEVVAGTGLTGGGNNGSVTLNVSGGSGITAFADYIDVNSTVVRTTGAQSIAGNKTFTGDTTIQGSLSVTGDFTYIDTIVAVTSAMSIVNHGTGPALEVCQAGANTIAHFCDSESGTALFIKDGGNVGIGTATPSAKLEVAGLVYQTGLGNSTYFGDQAGASDDLSDNRNVGVGYQSLYSNTSGYYNVANGYQALYLNTTGNFNIASGYQSLRFNTTGNYNVASGRESLFCNTSGSYNVASGSQALYANTTGSYNVASGLQALYYNTTGSHNVASGLQALFSNISGSANVASGSQALYYNTTGSHNIASGCRALYSNTEGCYNVATGYQALNKNTTGNHNIASGRESLFSNISGTSNIANGAYSLQSNTTGCHNIATGYQALNKNTTGNFNVASGLQALYYNTTGSNNIASGYQSLHCNISGTSNVAIGYQALNKNTTGNYNVASGEQSLYCNTSGTGNVASGLQALYLNTTGAYNVATGYRALYANTTGSNNIATGYQAGRYIANGSTANETSSNSLYLGVNTKALSSGGTNEIVIGCGATGLGSNTVTLGDSSIVTTALQGNVGIGTTTPSVPLEVNGSTRITRLGQATTYQQIEITDVQTTFNGQDPDGYMHYAFKSNDSIKLFINGSSGKVGIGTTAPTEKLDVAGNINVAGSGAYIRFNSGNMAVKDEGGFKLGFQTYNSTSGTMTTKMVLDTDGNVGIGTTLATNGKLVIAESGTSVGSTIRLIGTNTSGSASQVSHITSYQPASGAAEASALDFKVRGTDPYATPSTVMTLLGGGNVGIGTVSPGSKLNIAQDSTGNSLANGASQLLITGSTDANKRLLLGFHTTTNYGWLQAGINGTGYSSLALNPLGGNVGIGTKTPAEKLDVSGNIKASGTVTASGSGSSSFVGNVGIGTTTPGQKLDVAGNIAVSGTVDGRNVSVDGTKLDTIATSANNYSLPSGTSSVRGGFKIGYTENGKNYPVEVLSEQMFVNVPWTDANTTYTLSSFGVTATSGELNYTTGVTSAIQTQLNAKTTCTGTITGVVAGTDLTGGATSGSATLNVTSATASTVNTIVKRDSSGDINVRLLRSEYDTTNASIGYVMTQVDTLSNNYVRPSTMAQLRSCLNVADGATNVTNNTQLANGCAYITSSGNAATATTFSTGRTNYKGVTDGAVAGQLMWKEYGNNHTIFDASDGTSPTGSSKNNTNPDNAWSATYPTLMGFNGGSTYGVRVDIARKADCLTTARTIAGVSFNGSANISLNNNAITNGAGYTTCTGTVCTLGNLGVTATAAQLNYTTGVTSAIQTQLNTKTTCTGTISSVVAGNGLTGGATSGAATLSVGAGTAITVAAGTVGVTTACDTAWNAKTTCTGTVSTLGNLGVTATAAQLNYTTGVTSAIQTQLNTKTTCTGTVSTLGNLGVTATAAQLNYTTGVTSAIQTQLNTKTTCTGTISSVVAGTGLTGGGSTGSVTLSVGGGSGITAFEDYIDVNSTVVRTTGTQTIGGNKTFTDSVTIPNMTSPNAPASVTTSIVGNTVDVTFAESTTLNIDAYLVYSSIAGSDYGLISVITPEDFSASMSVIDNAFTETGTQAYRVYAMKNGVFSSAAASSVSYTVSSAEPSNVEVINMNNAYYVQWNPPSTNARFVTAYNVFKHEAATAGALLRASASQVYSGLNTNYMYQINGTNNNNYHQFWVETTIA
jgi:trimeric autotransporter adhesin